MPQHRRREYFGNSKKYAIFKTATTAMAILEKRLNNNPNYTIKEWRVKQ